MIIGKYDFSLPDSFENEARTQRFIKFSQNLERCSQMGYEELVKHLSTIYKADRKTVSPPQNDKKSKMKMPIFNYGILDATIREVFPYEMELMLRDPDCLVNEENAMRVYMDRIAELQDNHVYYSHSFGAKESEDIEAQRDRHQDTQQEEKKKAKRNRLDIIPSTVDRSIPEINYFRHEHLTWLRAHFPILKYKGVMDAELIYDLFNWLIFMPQEFAERLFTLDLKSVHVLCLVMIKKLKQKDVADIYGECPAAINKRLNRIIECLYDRSRNEIKAERTSAANKAKELRKYWGMIKKESEEASKQFKSLAYQIISFYLECRQ